MPLVPSRIATARLVLAPVSHELAASVVAGDVSTLAVGNGWPHDDTLDGLRMALAHGHAAGWFVTLDGVVIGDCGTHGDPDESGDFERQRRTTGRHRRRQSQTRGPSDASTGAGPVRRLGSSRWSS